jgi:hypothetical protein
MMLDRDPKMTHTPLKSICIKSKRTSLHVEEALTRYRLPYVSDEDLKRAAEEAWAEGK